MVTPSAGAIILVPFPFSDLTRSKLRPALVLAAVGRGDWIWCQITSRPYGDPRSVELIDDDFVSGSMHIASYVRPCKLFTATSQLMVDEVGRVRRDFLRKVTEVIHNVLQEGLSSSQTGN